MRKFTAIFILSILIIYAFIVSMLFGGCSGVRPVVIATDESVIAGQVSTARIEAINRSLREIVSAYEGTIGDNNRRAITGIDGALSALDEYDRFVEYCIARIRELELSTRAGESEGKNP